MLHNEGNPFYWGFKEERSYDSFYTAHEAVYSEVTEPELPTLATSEDDEELSKSEYVADFYSQEGMLYENIKRVKGFSPNDALDIEGDGCPAPEPFPFEPKNDEESEEGECDDEETTEEP